MAHRVLSHTADTGVEATADSLPRLLEELLAGVFGLMADIDTIRPERHLESTVEAITAADLVVDTVAEALYVSEVEDLLPCSFRVEVSGRWQATVVLGGVPIRSVAATGPAVKAVTYHDLTVAERNDGWYARVYLDV